MITTADPRGIRLIAGTNESRRIQRFRLLDTEGRRVPSAAYRVRMTPGPESGPGQIWTDAVFLHTARISICTD